MVRGGKGDAVKSETGPLERQRLARVSMPIMQGASPCRTIFLMPGIRFQPITVKCAELRLTALHILFNNMTKAEEIHYNKMMETYSQYLKTTSWKRKKDLKKSLASLEKDWFDYMKFKIGGRNAD